MSNYPYSPRLYPEPLRTLDYSAVTSSYIGIGSGLTNPSVQTIIQNWTDQPVMLSWDGINPHFPLAAGCAWDSDNCANRTSDDGAYLPAGQRFYVSLIGSTSPTSGAVYLTTFYGAGA